MFVGIVHIQPHTTPCTCSHIDLVINLAICRLSTNITVPALNCSISVRAEALVQIYGFSDVHCRTVHHDKIHGFAWKRGNREPAKKSAAVEVERRRSSFRVQPMRRAR